MAAGGELTALPGVARHRSRCLEPRDCRIRLGLPVTSPARALLDCAEHVPVPVLERAVSEAAVAGLIGPDELDDVLQRGRGRRGTAVLREIVADARDKTSDSEAEDRMDELIDAADIPRPIKHAKPLGFPVDMLWPESRLVVEVDGFRFHSQRRAFERDR